MGSPKSLLAITASSLIATPALAAEFDVGGQVNRAVMFVEDGYAPDYLGVGPSSEFYHVDNRNSPTRVHMGGTQRLMEGWTAGALVEVGILSNGSNDVTPEEKSIDGEFDQRITDAFIDSPWGKITVGHGEGAAYNAGRLDYSGTGVISFRNPSLIGGSLNYALKDSSFKRKFDADGNFTGTEAFDLQEGDNNRSSISGSIRDFNFEGRHERIRYDSPRLGPVTLSISTGHDSGSDGDESITQAGLKSGLRVPGGRMLIGLGYSIATRNAEAPNAPFDPDRGVDPDITTYGGSVSYYHSDTGFNVTLAAVNYEAELTSEERTGTFSSTRSELSQFRYIKLGYRPSRHHAFDIHYGETRDRNKDDEKGSVVGAGYVWSPTDMFDLYAGAKIHSFERGEWCTSSGRTCYNPEYEDITIVTTGGRVKF
ncbi:porin [Alcanivorax sp. 521-1]|uniref:Porin n=1 Tax=Alloalcanivorax profundimaris TaxID=2735259 RepID=A0ABS0AV23_9GAMM|nr:porin [Alloalcanivorax profundimaris]MBF5057804.1 porin [Alloalcanivorax profundimaris]